MSPRFAGGDLGSREGKMGNDPAVSGSNVVASGSPRVADGVFHRLPIEWIDSNREQPRRTVNGASLDELTRSITEPGILQPIRVRRRGDRHEVVAGHRRLMAARAAGLTEIPAVVVDVDDDQALIE